MYSSGTSNSIYSGNPSYSPTRQEPMALGSISPGNSPTLSSNQYLPSFLTGDSTAGFAATSPRIWSMAGSPNKQMNLSQSSPAMQGGNVSTLQQSPNQSWSSVQNRSFATRLTSEKSNGPPVTGLFETISSPSSTGAKSPYGSPIKNGTPYRTSIEPTSLSATNLFSPESSRIYSSPAQLDPFYTQREDLTSERDLDEAWVTVFGFPSAAASYILQQFSQYGTILEYKMESGGNWMHLHYQSKLQAKKALSKSGKVYGGTMMVGVKPCIEKRIMDESAKENSLYSMSSLNENEDRRTIGSIRPLQQAYRVSASERDVTKPNRTPQKSNNLISRTMDYMFGW